MEYHGIVVEKKDRVARITLNRPPMNIMDIPTIQEMNHALEQVLADPSITFLVFAGSGDKAFSAGVDIKDHTLDRIDLMLRAFHQIFRAIDASDKISIASVHGLCLGGGMELATFCDFVIAADNTVFGQPEIKVGCYPPVATAFLPRLIGSKKAFEITLLGENLKAEEALQAGLINKVVPYAQLPFETDVFVNRLANLSASVLPLTKRALRAGMAMIFSDALAEAERIYLTDLVQTNDIREGIGAFMEKRKPAWKHK